MHIQRPNDMSRRGEQMPRQHDSMTLFVVRITIISRSYTVVLLCHSQPQLNQRSLAIPEPPKRLLYNMAGLGLELPPLLLLLIAATT